MSKRAVSVTLDTDNLHWLRGQARAAKTRGLSETLDRLVSDARRGGRVQAAAIRSVVGTVDIHPDDPALDQADAHVRSLFEGATRRPRPAGRRARRPGRRSEASGRG